MNRVGLTSRSCKWISWTMRRSSMQKRTKRQRWKSKAKNSKKEKADVAVIHLSAMGAAWTQPSRSSSSRREQSRQGSSLQSSKVDSTGCMAGSISRHQSHRMCPRAIWKRTVKWRRRRSGGRGTQEISEPSTPMDPQRWRGRNEGFRAASKVDPVLVPINGAWEGTGDEFDSRKTEAGSQMYEEISRQPRQDFGHSEGKELRRRM